ncbi:hypothetical protein [Streptomyces sp. NPDC088847]|uniref:hypothetical protein n=1 Tax=Streptomyces sp. NPDC088847 TaxID=3365909 RepID=UPI003810E014
MRVTLKRSPNDVKGLLYKTEDDRLTQLVRRLALENAVPIHTWEPDATTPDILPPFSLAAGSPDEVFDRLYPPEPDNRRVGDEKQRLQLRDEFIGRATELLDDKGRRIGLATLWKDMYYLSRRNFQGIVSVNGLLADESVSFSGYLAGQPSRASRDRAGLIADQDQVRLWMRGQEQHLRAIGQFGDPVQLELSYTFNNAFGELADDIAFAFTSKGVLRPGDAADWARGKKSVFMATGMPLASRLRPPEVYHYLTGQKLRLPEDWVLISTWVLNPPLSEVFPAVTNRDPAYEYARNHTAPTWQKEWWRLSGSLHGVFLRALCQAWDCTIESLLAPIEQRNWADACPLGEEIPAPIAGYLLTRPPA